MDTYLLKRQMTAAYQYSYTGLALNYYTFFETMADATNLSESTLSCVNSLTEVMGKFYDQKDSLKELEALRNCITHEMEIIAAYTDCFVIYEYVLNRMERKFKTYPESVFTDEAFTQRLISYVTGTKDTGVRNGKIALIIGQLPVRLTKQKFFNLVSEGLSVYTDSPKENLQDMMYILRTESMISLPEHMEAGCKELFEILEQFRHMDTKTMTAAAYEDACTKISYGSDMIMDLAGFFTLLQDVINDLYVLVLSKEHAVIDVKEEELYRFFIGSVLEKFREEDFAQLDDSVADRMTELEGRQEIYYERYLRHGLPAETEELRLDPDYICLANIDLLLSGSSFVDLKRTDECKAADREPADRTFVDLTIEHFFKELEQAFDGMERPVIRAIMATILSSLPVCFNSINEVSAYIRGSLETCTDGNEKETCKELLEKLMDDETDMV